MILHVKSVLQYLQLICRLNQTDAAFSQKNYLAQCALWKQLHILYIMFSIFFIYTHLHPHTHIRRNTWICIRSACPQKYVDLVRVEVQEELRIRRAMKYWSRSRRAEHLAGEGGKIYVSTRCSLHITRRWWRSSLWSASSGGEQTDSKAQNPSEHRLHADPDWRRMVAESLLQRGKISHAITILIKLELPYKYQL